MNSMVRILVLWMTLGVFPGMMPLCAQKVAEPGGKAYDFVGFNEKGDEIRLSDFEGRKYVLLNFSATACAPCWKTYLPMNEIQEKYKGALKVISFHTDDAKDQWNRIAEHHGLDFQCTTIWEAIDKEKISEVYQIDGWPYFFLIDQDGIIVEKWFGNSKRKLKRKVRKHL